MDTCDKEACLKPGSIVWAKVKGYPWWPAMVDRDPVGNDFLWTEEGVEEATHYNVVFLDEKLSRSWVRPKNLILFNGYESLHNMGSFVYGGKDYHNKVHMAFEHGKKALMLKRMDRVDKYGFQSRIKENGIQYWYENDTSTESDDTVDFVDNSKDLSPSTVSFSKLTDPTRPKKRKKKQNRNHNKNNNDHRKHKKTDKKHIKRSKRSKKYKKTKRNDEESSSDETESEVDIDEFTRYSKNGLLKTIFSKSETCEMLNTDLLDKLDGLSARKKKKLISF